jgi:hypothetical protein
MPSPRPRQIFGAMDFFHYIYIGNVAIGFFLNSQNSQYN